ncbi:MAG: efflux RND transporter permease subunit, partial [Leptospiraceae bacterium]|nr:efflux RND transporter permease subunit [Leptospiraceae bacterium]
QVIIQVNYAGQPPQIVEDQVTYPLTTRMLSVPFAKSVRGYSFFGFSLVYVLFEDGTDLYWARSRILEYLNSMQGKLPAGVTTELGPDATGVGWVYEYALVDETGKMTLADLRDLQDFVLRYEITALPGIAEVASLGGFRRQFQVEVNPDQLLQYNIRIGDLEMAIRNANMEMGARLFQHAEKEFMVLAHGYLQKVDDLKQIPIRANEQGAVLRLGDVAQISEGPDIRRGLADLNGKGEVVGAIVIMRKGEDVPRVIDDVKKKLAQVQKTLPEGVKIVTTYDRSEIIREAVSNLRFKLIEELIVVSIITLIFLLHVRSALVSLIVLPLGVLFTFLMMHLLGQTANIMSMGGIAIAVGVMIDSSVVMVENTHKHLEKLRALHSTMTSELYWQAAREAVSEVAPGLFWSMVIIIVSFTPVFALPEQSGRLFIPLALTKTLAMTAAAILAVMLMPILVGYFIRGEIKPESKHPVSIRLIKYYEPTLTWCLDNKPKVIIASVAMLLF